MREGGIPYLTWFYSMKIIHQGSSTSPFSGHVQWTWCNLTPGNLLGLLPSPPPHPPQMPHTRGSYSPSSLLFWICGDLCLEFHVPPPWLVNSSFCPDPVLAEPCNICVWPLPVGPGHLGLLRPASCTLLCGRLTCRSSSFTRTVTSPRAGSTSYFLYRQCQPNAWHPVDMQKTVEWMRSYWKCGAWPLSEANSASF